MQFNYGKLTPFRYDTDSQFTDIDSDTIWWKEHFVGASLMDGDLTVGKVQEAMGEWYARPHWEENSQVFTTEEEARAWLATMYRLQ